MVIGKSCDLRKMGYAEHLVAPGQALELLADRFCGSPTNAGINFVENQGALHPAVPLASRRSPSFHTGLQCQQDTRQFPARSNLLQRPQGFAWVDGNHVKNPVET